jgi:hypothetical protein
MYNDKVNYLIGLCLDLNKNENGDFEQRTAQTQKPCAMVYFSGHIAGLMIQIYESGWGTNKYYDKTYTIYLDQPIDTKEFEEFRDYILELTEKTKNSPSTPK